MNPTPFVAAILAALALLSAHVDQTGAAGVAGPVPMEAVQPQGGS
jgi:hypothetical protein